MSVNVNFDSKIDKIFADFKKLSPALIAVAIASGLILFLPYNILERMALDKLPDLWKRVIGIIFIVSVALIVTIVLVDVYKKVRAKIRYKLTIKKLRSRYLQLSNSQKALIKKMLHSRDKSSKLDCTSGDVLYLQENDFIHQAEKYMFFGSGYTAPVTFAPQPWLLDLYKQEPEIFK